MDGRFAEVAMTRRRKGFADHRREELRSRLRGGRIEGRENEVMSLGQDRNYYGMRLLADFPFIICYFYDPKCIAPGSPPPSPEIIR